MLEWYNLIFYLPLTIGLLFALGAGIDFGHDVDGEPDIDADADIHADADHDADHDSDHDGENESFSGKILSFIGFGKVPVAISFMSLFLIFGGVGIITNKIIGFMINVWSGFSIISIIVSILCSLFGTAFISRLVSRVIPTTETDSVTKHDLIGCFGKVTLENGLQGIAQITNNNGDMYQIRYKSDKHFPYGAKIITIEYDSESDYFMVDPDPTVE